MSDFAVVCRTCFRNVYEGNTAPADGQVLLTAFADSVTGTACPSKIDPCPHKTTVITAAKQQTVSAILTRLAAVEAKVKP